MSVGCVTEGEDCLVLAIYARQREWHVKWVVHGRLDDAHRAAFASDLRRRTGRRPLWVPLVGLGARQDQWVRGIDMGGGKGKGGALSRRERKAALKTQIKPSMMLESADSYSVFRDTLRGPGGSLHLIGAATRTEYIDKEYHYWTRTMRIINPHLGSAAVALVNVYLALYPDDRREAFGPARMLVHQSGDTALVCYMDDWRLVDVLTSPLLEEDHLNRDLLDSWQETFIERHGIKDERRFPVACEVSSVRTAESIEDAEKWDPFGEDSVKFDDDDMSRLIGEYGHLAPIAFGMALHGG